MLPRFYTPALALGVADSRVALPADEGAHASRVLRLSRGERVRVFDGAGHEWLGEIAEISKQQVVVSLIESLTPAPEPRVPIALAIAILKGDKMDDAVRDAVMLGAAAIQPLITERTEFSLAGVTRGNKVERWQRIAIASAKQCGRAVVPAIHLVQRWNDFLQSARAGTQLMLVEPEANGGTRTLRSLVRPSAATLIVGPEGGWTDGERRDAAAAGITAITMGGITLRADSMPLVALTAARTLWDDL